MTQSYNLLAFALEPPMILTMFALLWQGLSVTLVGLAGVCCHSVVGAGPGAGCCVMPLPLLLSPALPPGRWVQSWPPARCLLSNKQHLLFQMNIDAQCCVD